MQNKIEKDQPAERANKNPTVYIATLLVIILVIFMVVFVITKKGVENSDNQPAVNTNTSGDGPINNKTPNNDQSQDPYGEGSTNSEYQKRQ